MISADYSSGSDVQVLFCLSLMPPRSSSARQRDLSKLKEVCLFSVHWQAFADGLTDTSQMLYSQFHLYFCMVWSQNCQIRREHVAGSLSLSSKARSSSNNHAFYAGLCVCECRIALAIFSFSCCWQHFQYQRKIKVLFSAKRKLSHLRNTGCSPKRLQPQGLKEDWKLCIQYWASLQAVFEQERCSWPRYC